MGRKYSQVNQTYTTAVAVAKSIVLSDDFDVLRIDIVVDIAPTTAGSLTITKTNSALGATYSALIETINMVGVTSYSIANEDGLKGFKKSDSIDIAYANADARTITVAAMLVI